MFLRFFKDIKRRQGTRRSWKWRWVRARYLDIYSECAVCGSTKALEVHHVVPIHVNKTLELKFSNLITLCESKK
ncbi:MAG: hypothetical protein EB078_10235, partial [Proteobacteria bacterium]|nr:hypothetical protein [Pseudomonadota bacterium]